MDIGILNAIRNHPGRPLPLPDIYDEYLGDCVLAEQLGFDHAWFGEHRMTPDSWAPSPVAVMATLAARTSVLRMGPAVACLPFHNPLRLAEDYAVLDILSKGRIDFGFGVGSQFEEFRSYGVDPSKRLGMTYEAAAFIDKCFSSAETFSWEGTYYRFPEVTFTTRPVQARIPFYAAAIGPKSLATAAERGYNLLAIRQPGYDAALRENGRDPADHRAIPLQMVHVAATEERAWEESIEGLHFFANFYAQRRRLSGELPDPATSEVTRDTIRGGRMRIGAPAVGTPDQVLARLQNEIQRFPGTTGMAIAFRHAGMRTPEVHRSLRLFAAEVMPHLMAGAAQG